MTHIRCRAFTLIAALALFSTAASQATAQILAGGGGTLRTDGGKVVGISLNSFGQTITSLGFYDNNQDGINASYQLGLWDASQNLLATATVTPSSPLTGDFRYAAISPVTIGTPSIAATFTIGVLLPQNLLDPWQDNATIIPLAGFTGAGTGQFSPPANTLVYPSSLDNSNTPTAQRPSYPNPHQPLGSPLPRSLASALASVTDTNSLRLNNSREAQTPSTSNSAISAPPRDALPVQRKN